MNDYECGFRITAELGVRAYPTPHGVAGSLLLGWAFPHLAEIHFGVGWSLAHGVLPGQARLRLNRYRARDLLVVPRLGVGFGKHSALVEAEAMAGLRVRLGGYVALYGLIGPGLGHTTLYGLREARTRFILPTWFGFEVRAP